MTHGFRLFPRSAVLALSALAFAGCDANETLEPDSNPPADATGTEAVPVNDLTVAAAARRGIPIGHFNQPVSTFGKVYNGGHNNITPSQMLRELAAVRARGGRMLLSLAGSPKYYKEGGHFSMTKWKARVNRYKGINFTSFINDGTIIGHFMIDEPNDPKNWRGKPVTPSVLEEMARYSKQLWPGMATIVRVEPGYLGRNHRYLDAAWAQYLSRKGTPEAYLRRHVADAQQRRLALAVGLNVLHGGKPNGTRMTASEVKSWGSAMLNSSYPCAFISWTYDRWYLSSRGMTDAMMALRRKAESRSNKSCKG
jgi:hypothetical protein